MRAAVLHGPGDLRVEEVANPVAGRGEVVLAVTSAGVCGSDAAFFSRGADALPEHERGAWPLVLGHEFAGRVVDAADDVEVAAGELLACGAGISCGTCDRCRRGRTNLCRSYKTAGASRHGGLAEFVAVPLRSCLRAEEFGVSGDDAALAQPMSVACHAVGRADVREGDRVLVIGAGGIGAFAVWAAAQAGADVAVCDTNPERVALARALGAQRAALVNPDTPLTEHFGGDSRFDAILDTSGSELALESATSLVDRGGRIVLVGMHKAPRTLDLSFVTRHEISLLGTHAHVLEDDLSLALRLLARRAGGWADVAPVVLPLEELVAEALGPLGSGTASRVKTLIDPGATARRTYRR